MLPLAFVLSARQGRDCFGVNIEGEAGAAFSLHCDVSLGPGDAGTLRLSYAAFDHETAQVPAADYTIRLVARPWPVGSRRWFYECPLTGLAVANLYLPSGAHQFASRVAHGLAYKSQRLSARRLARGRLVRAYRKLDALVEDPTPRRPSGMRRKTYAGLVKQIEAARSRI